MDTVELANITVNTDYDSNFTQYQKSLKSK